MTYKSIIVNTSIKYIYPLLYIIRVTSTSTFGLNKFTEEEKQMMNINCSLNCSHEQNGKCTLNHVVPISCFSNHNSDCAYFQPKVSEIKETAAKV